MLQKLAKNREQREAVHAHNEVGGLYRRRPDRRHHDWAWDIDAQSRPQLWPLVQVGAAFDDVWHAGSKMICASTLLYAKRASKWLQLRFFADDKEWEARVRTSMREAGRRTCRRRRSASTNATTAPGAVGRGDRPESCGMHSDDAERADISPWPLHGFADSLNLSVAAALFLQRLQDIDDPLWWGICLTRNGPRRRLWGVVSAHAPVRTTTCRTIAAHGGVLPRVGNPGRSNRASGWLSKSVVESNRRRANGRVLLCVVVHPQITSALLSANRCRRLMPAILPSAGPSIRNATSVTARPTRARA